MERKIKDFYLEKYTVAPEDYNDTIQCRIEILLDIYLKIKLDNSGTNHELKTLLNNIFLAKDLGKEMAQSTLCSLIRDNKVIENDQKRYELD